MPLTTSSSSAWRSLKYELIYPGDFSSGTALFQALDRYFRFYNHRRPHQALGYLTPADLFPQPVNKEEVIAMMGALPPQTPWDLALFFPESMVFALLETAPAVQSICLLGG